VKGTIPAWLNGTLVFNGEDVHSILSLLPTAAASMCVHSVCRQRSRWLSWQAVKPVPPCNCIGNSRSHCTAVPFALAQL
jgi:hypothetical protein